MQDYKDIWTYLSANPLWHLTLTLVAYQIGSWIYKKGKMNPLLNPVLLAVIIVVSVLSLTGTRSILKGRSLSTFCWARQQSLLPSRSTVSSSRCAAPPLRFSPV